MSKKSSRSEVKYEVAKLVVVKRLNISGSISDRVTLIDDDNSYCTTIKLDDLSEFFLLNKIWALPKRVIDIFKGVWRRLDAAMKLYYKQHFAVPF